MTTTDVLIAVAVSWTASLLVFPILPFQHWLNSRIRAVWKFLTFRPRGLTGTWLATYDLPLKDGRKERRTEIVHCSQLSGGEVRGNILDEGTDARYRFLGRIVFDELVAHYWSASEDSRDIGNFKFRNEPDKQFLCGPLTVYDSLTGETKTGVDYTWRRYPSRFVRVLKKVRGGRSKLDRNGLFANARFKQNQRIGRLRLARAEHQGEHTIKFKDQHRPVKKPWKFLNHACEPNCILDWREDGIALRALREVLPQEELTIDYTKLPEKIGKPFRCRCAQHIDEADRPLIGD